MWGKAMHALLLTLLVAGQSFIDAAPFSAGNEGISEGGGGGASKEHAGTKSDLTVEQLEKLKSTETNEGKKTHEHSHQKMYAEVEVEQFEKEPGQNVTMTSHLTKEVEVERVDGQPPHVHAKTELEIPSEGVHRIVVQDGAKVSVQDSADTHKEKVFRGAARLVQPSSVAGDTPPQSPANTPTSNGNRRSFNADITRENNNNVDHFSSYTGVQYSPLDMAEYVFWTGDERGVTTAIEEFLQEGLMTKEEAIAFLQEIKYNMEYLKTHYSQQARAAAEDSAQQERARNLIMEQAAAKEMYNQMQYRNRLQSFPFGNSADIIKTIANKNYELSNSLIPSLSLPVSSDYRSEINKRALNDPMLATNIINTSDYDRDVAPPVSEEEYEEMMDKLRAADSLYTQYTLEEVIYQLAKMMFLQTLSHEPMESRYAMQRFMNFLEAEAERGQLSRNIEKKVLDVMIAALSDTVAEHPELTQPTRDGYGSSAPNRFMHQMTEMGVSEATLSRALLAAYKDELTKGQLMQKIKGFQAGN